MRHAPNGTQPLRSFLNLDNKGLLASLGSLALKDSWGTQLSFKGKLPRLGSTCQYLLSLELSHSGIGTLLQCLLNYHTPVPTPTDIPDQSCSLLQSISYKGQHNFPLLNLFSIQSISHCKPFKLPLLRKLYILWNSDTTNLDFQMGFL